MDSYFSPKIKWHHIKKKKGNITTEGQTLKPPYGEPRAAEAEELLCIAIMYFHIEVIKTPVFVISQIATSNNCHVR